MSQKVTIGCRLANGIILSHPKDHKNRVQLNGLRDSKIIGATHCTTQVDVDFWNAWKAAAKADHEALGKILESGSVFEAKDLSEASKIDRELEKVKTGFEQLNPNAFGVIKADAA